MSDAIAARLAPRERQRVTQLVVMGYFTNESDFVRDAVRARLADFQFAVVRDATVHDVRGGVLAYVRAHPDVYADEIAAALGFDIETVIAAIEHLVTTKKVTT